MPPKCCLATTITTTSVNAADYTVWRNNLGDLTEEDINFSGNGLSGVDTADYTVWKQNYGNVLGGSGGGLAHGMGQVVPEPGSLLLCLLASAGAACIRIRR